MMATVRALAEWFEQFGIGVYQEMNVPDEAEAPYITLPLREPEWDMPVSYQFTVWYKSTSNLELIQKADEIVAAVTSTGTEGARIPCDGGRLVLYTDNPLMQDITDNDYKGIRISFILRAYHMPGV